MLRDANNGAGIAQKAAESKRFIILIKREGFYNSSAPVRKIIQVPILFWKVSSRVPNTTDRANSPRTGFRKPANREHPRSPSGLGPRGHRWGFS